MKGKCDRLYRAWYNAISRCTKPSNTNYKRYGGRGIKVCDEWLNDFHAFKNWALSNGYREGLTLDRIDFNKGYSPDNCRWATYIEQNNNRSSNNFYTIDGETKTLPDWCRFFGVNYNLVRARISRGMDVKEALRKPPCPNLNDLTGRRFGRLVVIRLHNTDKNRAYFECLCDCGKTKIVYGHNLISGATKSCGCFRMENTAKLWKDSTHRHQKVINKKTGVIYESIEECIHITRKSRNAIYKMLNNKNSYLQRL